MQFELTSEQAATLSRAAHLVMEYLPVSERKRRTLASAQQELHKTLGSDRLFQSHDVPTASPPSAREYRGLLIYQYGYPDHNDSLIANPSPDINLTVYYDRTCEDVAVTLSFDRSTFPVEDRGEWYEDGCDKDERPFPDVAWFSFPACYSSKVQLTISTPRGIQGATYLLTKQGIVTELQMINLDIDFDCPKSNRSVKEPV